MSFFVSQQDTVYIISWYLLAAITLVLSIAFPAELRATPEQTGVKNRN